MLRHCLVCCLAGTLLCLVPATAQPRPVLSGYTGAFYGLENQSWRDFLPLLRDNGFKAIDLKLHPGKATADDPGYAAWVGQVAKAVQDAGLELHVWLYDGNRGQRPETAPLSLAFVGPDGMQSKTRYCLYQLASWQMAYARLFELARLSRSMPIKSVKMDIEMLLNGVPCVCDDCFGSFAAKQHAQGLQVEPAKRWEWVKQHGGEMVYLAHLEERMDRVAEGFARQAHEINPKLSLGIMPFADNHLRRPWARHLGTPQAPAYMEAWPMYNGLGYTADVVAEAKLVKGLNPNNLYIPWFRVNMYKPQEMADQAFIAAANGGGYNMWTIGMIHPSVATKKPAAGYELPVGFEDPMAYWQALGRANAKVAEWVKKPVPVELSPLKPLTIAVDLAKVQVPDLKPVLPNVPDPQPAPGPTGLRGNSKLYIQINDPAEPVKFTIRHLAGKARPTNLGFALVAANGAPVIEGQVEPGERKEVTAQVKEPGTYALLIQTSEGGGPWYDVKVASHPYAVDVTKVYFFRVLPAQYFHVPAGTRSFRIALGTGASEEVRLIVTRPDGSVALDEVHTGEKRGAAPIEITVPDQPGGTIWSLWVGKPEKMQADHYSENYFLQLMGVPPYVSDRPAAVLTAGF